MATSARRSFGGALVKPVGACSLLVVEDDFRVGKHLVGENHHESPRGAAPEAEVAAGLRQNPRRRWGGREGRTDRRGKWSEGDKFHHQGGQRSRRALDSRGA